MSVHLEEELRLRNTRRAITKFLRLVDGIRGLCRSEMISTAGETCFSAVYHVIFDETLYGRVLSPR